ncbi:MAG: MoxR family ATPase [Ktedonobacteraceae bacterium]
MAGHLKSCCNGFMNSVAMNGTNKKVHGYKYMQASDDKRGKYRYSGAKELQPEPGAIGEDGRPIYGYLPDAALVEAVNLAIYLKRPLLIKGEPGCGKTRLAAAVARELNLPYRAWYIKSTSRARDGLYIFDTLGRLRDAQFASTLHTTDISPANYVQMQALGQAFQNSERTVVLIDEIDKADIDFPNDLLLELDELSFVITETGETIKARTGAEPIIFITSNDEKDLPDAFLRRCLFHYINFPDERRLTEIINIHCPDTAPAIIDAAIKRFLELHQRMTEDKRGGGKKVSTSELIDWVRALHFDADGSSEQKVLAKLGSDAPLPYASTLLKSVEDQHYQEPRNTGALS